MFRLNQTLFRQIEHDVDAELDPFIRRLRYQDAAEQCFQRAFDPLGAAPSDLLRRFFFALWLLEHATQHGLLSQKTIRDLFRLSTLLLNQAGVPHSGSPLSELRSRLYRSLGRLSAGDGKPGLALWQFHISQLLAHPHNREVLVRDLLSAAELAFALGDTVGSLSAYVLAEKHSEDLACRAHAWLGQIRCLRLQGELEQAEDLVISGQRTFAGAVEVVTELAWQGQLCGWQRSGDASQLASSWELNSRFHQARYVLHSTLIAHAVPLPGALRKPRRALTLKTHFPTAISKGSSEFELFKLLLAVEGCCDAKQSLIIRLKNLGDFVAQLRDKVQPEVQLVFLAAIMRWLRLAKKPEFATQLANEFISLSYRVSRGRSADVLGLVPNLPRRETQLTAPRHRLLSTSS